MATATSTLVRAPMGRRKNGLHCPLSPILSGSSPWAKQLHTPNTDDNKLSELGSMHRVNSMSRSKDACLRSLSQTPTLRLSVGVCPPPLLPGCTLHTADPKWPGGSCFVVALARSQRLGSGAAWSLTGRPSDWPRGPDRSSFFRSSSSGLCQPPSLNTTQTFRSADWCWGSCLPNTFNNDRGGRSVRILATNCTRCERRIGANRSGASYAKLQPLSSLWRTPSEPWEP